MTRMEPVRMASALRNLRLRLDRLEDRSVPSVAAVDFNQLSVDTSAYDPSRILVRWIDMVGPRSFGGDAVALGGNWYRLDLMNGTSVPEALRTVRARAEIAAAEPDYIVHATDIPDDARFGDLWGMNNTGQTVGGNIGGTPDADIDAPEAWGFFTGSGQTVVAVIDTGVDYTHEDLAANIWVNADEIGGNGVDDDNNGYVDDIRGWDFANNDNNPMDDNGHGSHVSGTIAGIDNAVGVIGVNPNAKIMPLKFLGANGSGLTSNAVLALNYAVANGAQVSNNSYSGGGFLSSMQTALQNAAAAGHVFVAAAGNSNVNIDSSPAYPASYDVGNILSVAATDRFDNRSSFSNYGTTSVDLGAPGSLILSSTPGNTYSYYSGTSMASPHVAGAVALLRDLNPSWSYQRVINQVLSTVDALPALDGVTGSGGRLNLNRLLTMPEDTSGPTLLTADFDGAPTTFSRVRLTFSERVKPGTLTASKVSVSGPAGAATIMGVTLVANTNGTQYDVAFQAGYAPGNYSVTIGAGVTDMAGNARTLPATAGEVLAAPAGTVFTATNVPVTIRDRKTVTSNLTVGPNFSISDVNVRMTILHSAVGQLTIALVSPWGQSVTLSNGNGGVGDNMNGTVFTDEATDSITVGTAPFSAAYRPMSPLSAFDALPSNGTWQLRITDSARLEVGQLVAWSLVFNDPGV